MSVLVIIPCGKKKIWDKSPSVGPTSARDAYTGSPFKVNRQFAEYCQKRGADWLILSAKYGFVSPSSLIENYNVTFKQPKTCPVSHEALRSQVAEMKLDRYERVIAVGGREYLQAVRAAFAGTGCRLEFPAEGLAVGKAMARLKALMQTDYVSG